MTHTVSPEGDVASNIDDGADHGQHRLLLDRDIRRVLPVTVAAIGLLIWGLGGWLGLVGLFGGVSCVKRLNLGVTYGRRLVFCE